MVKWKRFGAAALAVLMSVSLLAGCGNKAKEEEKDGKVTIRFSWWGNDDRHKATQEAIDAFMKENPDITVKGEPSGFGSLEENFATKFAGGTEADVMTILYSWVAQYSANGDGFYDMDKVKDDFDFSQYEESFLKTGVANDVQIAVPYGQNTLGFFINKSALERAGVSEIPKTWDEYKAAAAKLPKGSFMICSPTFRFMANYYLQQKTGKFEFDEKGNMNYTEDDYKDALKWYKEMADAGVLCTRKDYLENVGTEPVSLAQNQKFLDGGYVGVFEWSGGLPSDAAALKEKGDECVVAPLPVIDGAKYEGTLTKPSLLFAISKNSKHPKEAAKFLNYILNEEQGVDLMGTSRGVPASKAAVEALTKDGQIEGVVKDGYEFGKDAKAMAVTPTWEDANYTNIYMTNYEKYELGQSSLDEAAKAIYDGFKENAKKLQNR